MRSKVFKSRVRARASRRIDSVSSALSAVRRRVRASRAFIVTVKAILR